MTLNQLIKKLVKIKGKGSGRQRVLVNKDSLFDGNGCFTACDISKATSSCIPRVDDDGFAAYQKNGTERTISCVLLEG